MDPEIESTMPGDINLVNRDGELLRLGVDQMKPESDFWFSYFPGKAPLKLFFYQMSQQAQSAYRRKNRPTLWSAPTG
jgi:hypothetical protein